MPMYIFICNSMNSVVKSCGQHLKAPIALVRLRLYETLSLIPAQDFEGNIILFTVVFKFITLNNKLILYNYSFIYTYFEIISLRIYISRKSCEHCYIKIKICLSK